MERDPLLPPSRRSSRAGSNQTVFQYYDPDAIFDLQPDHVAGYYTLLGGSPEADLTVAFFSLLDGNVLQSVFGLSPLTPIAQTGGASRTRVYLSNFQGDVAQERRIVYAYATLFRLLQEYHQDLRSACWCFPLCGPCARSCLRPRYKRVTLEAIDGAFQQLERDLALT